MKITTNSIFEVLVYRAKSYTHLSRTIEAVKCNIVFTRRNFQVWGFHCEIKNSVPPILYQKIFEGLFAAYHFFLETNITHNLCFKSLFPVCGLGSVPFSLHHLYSGSEQKPKNFLSQALHLWIPLELVLKCFLTKCLCKSAGNYVDKLDHSIKKCNCISFCDNQA